MNNKEAEEDLSRRNCLLTFMAVTGVASAPKTWTTPLINAVILPAHAQASCLDIVDVDVLGVWVFTDPNGQAFQLEFLDEPDLIIDTGFGPRNERWSRGSDGVLSLDIASPKSPWLATISGENDCVASKILIFDFQTTTSGGVFEIPINGIRI